MKTASGWTNSRPVELESPPPEPSYTENFTSGSQQHLIPPLIEVPINMFIQLLIRLSVVTGFALASVCGTAGTEFGCTAPELIQGVPALNHYNELICSGISYVESGKYAAAVKSFEEALAIKIHESPNFELLPRLAWARFKQGDISAARDDLMRAELSLSVFAGLIHCQETDVGFHLKKIVLANG